MGAPPKIAMPAGVAFGSRLFQVCVVRAVACGVGVASLRMREATARAAQRAANINAHTLQV